MWIERVTARAFGPLLDDTLELGEGMSVIAGPNEAGKTSWHAATRLALTGVRRGPGRTKEVATVIERHRPWDSPDRWEVEARLHLADGRTVDISQDLAGRVACRARDVVLGDNVSMEIINEGTPDATRWLGLDRDSFAAVAAVGQAQVMAVADNAAALQEHLQRAAATRGTDATAAEAIERLKAFRKEAVGAVRQGATGPLWGAMREQEAADASLAEARGRHADYLDRQARLEEAIHAADGARKRLAAAEAAVARKNADELSARIARATALAEKHPTAPAALAARDEAADEVAAALESWRHRPSPMTLAGETAAELRARLASLPLVPEGDRRPDRSVVEAVRRLDLAEAAQQARRAGVVDEQPSPRATWPFLASAGIAAAGALLIVAGQAPIGVVLLIAAAALLGWRTSLGAGSQPVSRSSSAGIPDAVESAAELLRSALLGRGAPADGDLREAVAAYEAACAEREDLAHAAAGGEALRRAIEARSAAEASAEQAASTTKAAEGALRAAASRIGESGEGDPDRIAALLVAWQGRRAALARASETAIREWQELQGLLAGRTLDELKVESARKAQVAADLARQAGSIAVGRSAEVSERHLTEARAEASRVKEVVDALTGELRLLATTLVDVAEAEERASAATAELARVQELASVLDETLGLLEAAERRVHRDLAPVLTASVQRHLAAITGGAYVEVGMNPRDLSVDVKEARTGQWRDARLLSEGTREQIYLLLRVAMAEHLVTTDETSPLLLDEVTAQSDPERKRRILDVLHAISADRQVILFSHDDEVVAWASESLREPRDRLVRLTGRSTTTLAEAASR